MFIFIELWKEVCEGKGDNHLEKSTLEKEIAIWETRTTRPMP